MSYNTRIKLKSDTESNWLSQDPVLLDGEVAIVKCDGGSTRKKIGDGYKKFSELSYDESKSLGLTSAAVGQIPKVKAVDSNGVPTEWEPAVLSGDMVYVLNAVRGEGGASYTINDNFDDVVAAIEQGKIVVLDGLYLPTSRTSKTDGTVISIEFTAIGKGIIMSLTWNRGHSAVAVTVQSFPTFGLEPSLIPGAVYYDKGNNKFIIKDTTPPIASTSTVGTIKVGNGLSISADGTLSVTTATYYTGTADPVNTLGADGDLYLQTEG